MAIQFARVQYVSRSSGGNACRKSAYNARDNIECERTGETFNFKHKTDLSYHEVILPEGVCSSFKDPKVLWNAAEKAEKRKDSQVQIESVIALPDNPEITHSDKVEISRRYAKAMFADKGLGVQINIHMPHDGEKNWHAHILSTTRRFSDDGLSFSSHKARDADPVILNGYIKNETTPGEIYAKIQNAYFTEKGIDLKVDATRIIPEEHMGPVRMRKHMGAALERLEFLREANEEAVRNPDEILKKLTRYQAIFAEKDVDHLLRKHMSNEEIRLVKEQVFVNKEVICLYDKVSKTKTGYWTTKSVRAEEEKLLGFSKVVNENGAKSVEKQIIDEVVGFSSLSNEQRAAVEHAVMNSKGLSIVQGRAGTGKSYTMEHIRKIYERSGYRVIGLAATNQVVQDMAKDGFKEVLTVHSSLFKYKNDRFPMGLKTVLVVDEAAMLGNSAMVEMMNMAKKEKAKLVLFGDDRQLSSVERGGMFNELVKEFGSSELVQVRRQSGWQKEVSELLSEGRNKQAVDILQERNVIDWSSSKEEAMSNLIKSWGIDTELVSDKSRLILASKNVDVDALNLAVRELRVSRGEVSEVGYRCQTVRGKEVFSANDRVCLSVTDKKLGLNNGSFGTIESINEKSCSLKLDNGKQVEFDHDSYRGLKLGYAATVYKSQGKTINSIYVLHDGSMNNKINYVALTRQEETLKIFANKQDTVNVNSFVYQISRGEDKTSSLGWATFDQTQREKDNSQGKREGIWQVLKSKAKHFISDTFHKNDDFYRIPAKSLSNEGINSNVEKIEADIKTAEVEYSLSNKGEVSKGNDWLAQDSKPVESNSQSIGKEGKTVNIAEKLLPDWEVLKGKDVTIWADNNIAGIKAAAKVKDTLNELNSQNAVKAQIKIVKLPEDLPVKLDLVNKMSEAMSIDRLKDVNTGFDKAKEISANEVKINLTLEKAGSLNQLQKQEKLPHWKDLLEQKLKLPTDNEIFKEQLQALGLKDTFENAGTPVSKFTERLNEVHMEKYGRPIEVLSSQSNNRGSEPSATFTYTSYIEVIADEFISAYKERAFADQHDLLTVLQKEEFKENIKSVAKDKDLISTIKTRNPEVGKEVEALAKSYNREIQQQRGFDLSR